MSAPETGQADAPVQAAAIASHTARLASFWNRHGRDIADLNLPAEDDWWAALTPAQQQDEIAGALAAIDAAAPVTRDDTGTIKHIPTGATWVTWNRHKQPPWDLIAEAVSRITDGKVKIRAGRENEDDGGDPDRRYAAIYINLPEDDE